MAEDDRTDETLAAEYVLGVLEGAERAEVAARIGRDAAFARRVASWEDRLGGLGEGYDPVAPPSAAKAAIDARLFGAEKPRFGWGRWLSGALAATLAAAVLLAFVFPPVPSDRLVAELAADGSDFTFSAEIEDGTLQVALASGTVPDDRDLELWLIVGDAAPVSLGLFTAERTPPPTPYVEGQILAVSLEPKGGSTTGAPTGPVVALGELKKISDT